MPSAGSVSARPSWLAADLLRLLRPLNMLDMRRRWADDVSLRPSSEARLFSLSSAPSVDRRSSSSRASLLATETADDAGPLDVARLPGAARLSLLEASCAEVTLRARSTAAMAVLVVLLVVLVLLGERPMCSCSGVQTGFKSACCRVEAVREVECCVRGGEVDYVAGVQNERDAGKLAGRTGTAVMSVCTV
jgi:hypothetical protein